MQIVKGHQLQVGDRVRLSDGEFSDVVVKKIENGEIHFYRPYAHTSDFSYTGGVLCYVGIEEFSRSVNGNDEYILLRRVELR